MTDDLIGVTINNYQIQELRGGGGMGIVYRARHPILKMDVAIKVMRPELASQEGFYERFEREAMTIARLQHPGILGVSNFGKHEGMTYLMMDYINGPTLRQLLRDSPFGLPLETAARLTHLVAEALAYAHGKGVLHLDLKPDNILLDPDRSPTAAVDRDCPYRPVISDFGLARLRLAPGISIHTTQVIGTPHYMSPEQCLGKSLDERSDIYSLGVMLYETLTGQRPFPITSLVQAAYFHGSQPPSPPSTHVSSLPSALDELVLAMLAKDPTQRTQSAGEVAEQLSDVLVVSTPPPALATGAVREATVVTPPVTERWSLKRTLIHIEVTYQGRAMERFPMKNESLLVGRLPTCDLRLEAGDKLVSKRHCEVLWRSGEVVVRDLHSTNKTFVGDAQLEPDAISPWPAGAPLRVGSFTLKWAPARTGELPDFGAPAQAERPTRGGIGPRIECASANPKTLRLTSGTVTIGRLLGCEFIIADPAVSKRHCAIHWDGRQVRVEDLGSTNGTFLGEVRLESHRPTVWEPGTAVRIGPHTIQLAADQ